MPTERRNGWNRIEDEEDLPPLNPRKVWITFAALAILGFLIIFALSGCKTALTSDKIITVKQRVFGIVVETANTANATPSVKLGLVTTVVHVVPTSTNGPIFAPAYVDKFDLTQSGSPFKLDVAEDAYFGVSPPPPATNAPAAAARMAPNAKAAAEDRSSALPKLPPLRNR